MCVIRMVLVMVPTTVPVPLTGVGNFAIRPIAHSLVMDIVQEMGQNAQGTDLVQDTGLVFVIMDGRGINVKKPVHTSAGESVLITTIAVTVMAIVWTRTLATVKSVGMELVVALNVNILVMEFVLVGTVCADHMENVLAMMTANVTLVGWGIIATKPILIVSSTVTEDVPMTQKLVEIMEPVLDKMRVIVIKVG